MFISGGIAWTVENEVRQVIYVHTISCLRDSHLSDHMECTVTAEFPRGFYGSRSIAVKFYDAGGVRVRKSSLFIEQASPHEVVEKKLLFNQSTATSAKIVYY